MFWNEVGGKPWVSQDFCCCVVTDNFLLFFK